MVLFAIELHRTVSSVLFIDKTIERLNKKDITKNPFTGKIKYFNDNQNIIVYFDMNPIYPDISYILLFPIVALIVFQKYGMAIYIITSFFLLLKFLHTKYFYYLLLKKGLRKYNYNDNIKLLGSKEMIRTLLYKNVTS